jgi:hypothetical protein
VSSKSIARKSGHRFFAKNDDPVPRKIKGRAKMAAPVPERVPGLKQAP